MKKVVVIVISLLFVGAMVFAINSDALAAGKHGKHHGGYHGGHHGGYHGGHHGGHHGGFWGPGFGWGYGGFSVVLTNDCYMVKKCRVNRFGERRCRWVQVCY